MPEDDFLDSLSTPDDTAALPDDLLGFEADAPDAPVAELAPEVTPEPVNDDPYGLKALASEQRELLKSQREQVERQNAPQPTAAPKALLEQEAWSEEYYAAMEASSYDPGSRQKFARMNQELVREGVQQGLGQMRGEMQAQFSADSMVGTLRSEAKGLLGDMVDDATLDAVTSQVFGGDRTLMGNALKDPSVRQLVIDAAAGRRMRDGKTVPPSAPQRPAPPPSVQSSARDTRPAPDSKETRLRNFTDRSYMSGVIDDLLFGKPKSDHEELLK